MDKIPNKKFTAKVLSNEFIAEGVKKLTFKVDELFNYDPWQYVWLEIPNMSFDDSAGNRRAFSILNIQNKENTISLVARESGSGFKKSFFALKVGDSVIVHGPFGSSFIVNEKHQPENIIMIAGGVGVAEFMPMIESIRVNSYKSKCFLTYLNREEKLTPFLKELKSYKENTDFFDYKVSYEYFSWDDVKDVAGRISGKIEWWIVGTQGMVDFVFDILIKNGVPKEDMVFENYYPTKLNSLKKEAVDSQLNEDNIFAKAIQNTTNHSVITDVDGKVLFANKAAEEITGYSQAEILGNTPRLWGGLMGHDFYVEFWENVLAGKPFKGEIMNRRKNGEIYYALAHISPIFDKDKKVVGYIGTEEDITDIKKAEQDIIDKSAELDSLFEISEDMIGFVDFNGHWKRVNPALIKLLGYPMEEFLKYPSAHYIHPDDIELTQNEIKKLFNGERAVNFINRFIKSDGEYVVIQWNISIKGDEMYATGRDVTVAKENERDMERLTRAMIDRELRMVELKERIKELESPK